MDKTFVEVNQLLQKLNNIEIMLCSQNLTQKEVLNFKEAVRYLGFSPSHLYKLTSAGKISHYKPEGKHIYFNRSELDKWLLRNPVKTAEQIEQEATTFVSLSKNGR